MPSFLEFFNRRKRVIDELVDKTFFRLLESTAPIDMLFPAQNYADPALLIAEITSARATMANLFAAGQDVPASRQQIQITERNFKPYYSGKKITWTDRDFELLKRLEDAEMGGQGSAAFVNGVKQAFFKTMLDIVPSIYERSTFFALQVACGLPINYTDPLSGAAFTLSYPGTIAAHLPNALTGNARWSQSATCTPLTGLQNLAETVYGNLGIWQDTVVMHWANLRQVANSNECKLAKLQQGGATIASTDTNYQTVLNSTYVSDDEAIALIKQRTRSSNVILFDAQYSEEAADGTTTSAEFLPSNYVVFAHNARKNIKRAFLPVQDASGAYVQGVATITRNNGDIPYREWSTAVGASVPLVIDPRCLVAQKVA